MATINFNKVSEYIFEISSSFSSLEELAKSLDNAAFEYMINCISSENIDMEETKSIIESVKMLRDTIATNRDTEQISDILSKYAGADDFIKDLDSAAFSILIWRKDGVDYTESTEEALQTFREVRNAFVYAKTAA